MVYQPTKQPCGYCMDFTRSTGRYHGPCGYRIALGPAESFFLYQTGHSLNTHTMTTPSTHSIDPAWVRSLQEDLARVQKQVTLRRDHLYPEQIRWPLLAWPMGGRSISSDSVVESVHQLSQALFPEEQIYWLGYAEQIQPSGPHIDVVHGAQWSELDHSHRTVLIPLTEHPTHWTCTFDMWARSPKELDYRQIQARFRAPDYPAQRDLWPRETPWALKHWQDRVPITHRMQDQIGLLHTWDVSNVHTSSWWDYQQNDDRPTRTFLIWHTLAPGRPLPDRDSVRQSCPWID